MQFRNYDLVLWGATGFTGGLIAQYLMNLPTFLNRRWAIAGRSQSRLETFRDQLRTAPGPLPDILIGDGQDLESLKRICQQTRVILSTVGPYFYLGQVLPQACVETGTDYLDINGETAFVNRLIEQHHANAKAKGVLIVPCCGFDSIPADLGVLFTVEQLRPVSSLSILSYVTMKGRPSGGSWATFLDILSAGGKALPSSSGSGASKRTIHYEKQVSGWAVPMAVVDGPIVKRSAMLRGDYGNPFSYSQYLRIGALSKLVGVLAGMSALFLLLQIKPVKELLKAKLPSGAGPSDEQRKQGYFKLTLLANADGRRIKTSVTGGDPGYSETSKMVAEAALLLLDQRDKLPLGGGVATPASAFGALLIARLNEVGIHFKVE